MGRPWFTGRPWLAALVLAAVLAAGLRLVFFAVSCSQVPPSSDESISGLQALSITQRGSDPAFEAKQSPRGVRGRFPLLFMAQPYLFPLESYLSAPFAPFLPRSGVGVRTVPLLIGALSVLLGLWLLRQWGPWRDVWPGALLLLFPSAYVLILQAGAYALPSYPSLLFLCTLLLALAQRHAQGRGRPALTAALAGLCAGAAWCGSLLAVPVILGVAVVIVTSGGWRRSLVSTPVFAATALLAMSPYFLAQRLYPGAFGAVSGRVPWRVALERLWDPTLTYTLPVVSGITPAYWPDNERLVQLVPGLARLYPWLWCGLLLAAALLCAAVALRRWGRERWPSIGPGDAVVAAAALAVAMAVVSRRFGAGNFRYLLVAAWAFPFVLALLYRHAGRAVRVGLGALAVLLAALNAASSGVMIADWASGRFAADEAMLGDVRPAIAYLQSRGIDRAYASYHVAYRVTYSSREKILCSQLFNERFFGWPLPYKDAVDAATNVAVILTPRFHVWPEEFEDDLAATGVAARKTQCGEYAVYTDFRFPPQAEYRVDPRLLRVETSQWPQDAALLADGDAWTRWRSHGSQATGMWVQVTLPAPMPLKRLSVYYTGYIRDRARALAVQARTPEGWQAVAPRLDHVFDRFELINGHPVMGHQLQTLRFEPVKADALRLEIVEPEPDRDWSLGEIALWIEPLEERPAAALPP